MRLKRLQLLAVLLLTACSGGQVLPAGPAQPQELAGILAELTAPHPSERVSDLYIRGMAYAAQAEFAGEPGVATAAARQVEAAVNTRPRPPADELEIIRAARRQYALLGERLPYIPLAESLFAANETPRINTDYGSATVLLLFPDSCGSCVEMARGLRAALFRLSDREVHVYGLMAQAIPPVPAPSLSGQVAPKPNPGLPAVRLRGTPTFLVPPATVDQFGATAFPLTIATDSRGVVRFIGLAPVATALMPGGFVEQVAEHIARVWPPAAKQR